MTTTIPGQSRFTLEVGPGYVHLWQAGELADREDAGHVREEVSALLEQTGYRRLLMDNRSTKAPGEAIREFVWRWVTSDAFDRVAIVVKDESLATSIAERPDAEGRIRGFTDQDAATAWIRDGAAANG